MKTKLIGIIVCMLLILTIAPLSTTADDSIRKTITVDDGGGADYTKIQDAIDNASHGDTIFVFSGTYYENVIIGVSIDLVGEDKETTIIDAMNEGDTINVSAEEVTISGFNIQHNGASAYSDAGIEIHSDNCQITDNIIKIHRKYGILIKSSFNIVEYNTISNVRNGVMIHYGHDNLISDNTISKEIAGICLKLYCNNNTVCNNFVTRGSMSGISISNSIDNIVFKNHVYGNQHGIYLHTCSNNLIYENIIEKNWYVGVDANHDSEDNQIYHNDFINNDHNAYDYPENDSWDNGFPIGGNYWDDYDGIDENGDGIGDTPYIKDKRDNNPDKYPLMEPFGSYRISPGGPFYKFIDEAIQFSGYVCGGSPPYEWSWDFGDGNTLTEQNPIHTYTEVGEYDIALTVTDDEDNTKTVSTFAWIQDGNVKPYAPNITGPSSVKIYYLIPYHFNSTDPEGGVVWYNIDWGDGNITGWVGPFKSGEELKTYHHWTETGSYEIRAKSKDVFDEESDWETKKITVTKSRPRNNNPLFLRLFEQFPNMFPILRHLLRL